jgi:hypothetical protein
MYEKRTRCKWKRLGSRTDYQGLENPEPTEQELTNSMEWNHSYESDRRENEGDRKEESKKTAQNLTKEKCGRD